MGCSPRRPGRPRLVVCVDRRVWHPPNRPLLTSLRPPTTRSLSRSRSNETFGENMQTGLFGLTAHSWRIVNRITPGMPLFLYNLNERRFHGVFEAVSARPVHAIEH